MLYTTDSGGVARLLAGLLCLAGGVSAVAQPLNPVGFTGSDTLFENFDAPSDTAGPFEEISWTRGDAGSSFAAWENFAFPNDTANPPALAPQGPIGIPDTPLPILPAGGSADVTYAPDVSGAILTSTENLYTIGSEGEFQVSATGEGLGVGFDTRIALQVGVLGNTLPRESFRLEYTDAGEDLVVAFPIFNTLEQRVLEPEESPFGGLLQEYSAVWNIPGFSPDDYTLFFDASTNTSVSFVTLDAFAQAAVTPVPGDYTGDGVLDAVLDPLAWETQYGSSGFNADGNGDGLVDAVDYVFLREQLEATASVSVPEPSAAGYALIALTTAAFCWGTHAITEPRRQEEEEC